MWGRAGGWGSAAARPPVTVDTGRGSVGALSPRDHPKLVLTSARISMSANALLAIGAGDRIRGHQRAVRERKSAP